MPPSSARCGRCATCRNRALKQGCLVLRQKRLAQGRRTVCGTCRNCLNPQWKQRCLNPQYVKPTQGSKRRQTWQVRRPVKQEADAEEEAEEAGDEEVEEEEADAELSAGGRQGLDDGAGAEEPEQQAAAPRPPRGRKAAESGSKAATQANWALQKYHGLMFTSNYEFARRQHLSNLVFLLRHYASTHNWRRLAGVVATLMASERAESLSEQWMFRHPASRARLAEALEAGWVLLQHQPDVVQSYEQTRKFLKQWAAYQLAPAGREAVLLELARYSRAQGLATDAWDFLATLSFTTDAAERQRKALMACIRAEAWGEAMQEAARLLSAPPATASPNKRRHSAQGAAGGPVAWRPWQHDAQVWARGGRMAKELHQEALDCCQGALEQRPWDSDTALLKARLQLGAGDAAGALATARELRKHAPLDTDAAGLLALLLVARTGQQPQQARQQGLALWQEQQREQEEQEEQEEVQQQQAEEQLGGAADDLSPAAAAEAADCCCDLLAAIPSCHEAVATLLMLHDRHALPAARLASACCLYVEAQPPSWKPALLELRVWQHLAATLTQAAAAVVNCHRQLQYLQQQRQLCLPRNLRQLLRQRLHPPGAGTAAERQRWQQLQELTAQVVQAQRQLQQSLVEYRQCCAVMQARTWWRAAHLLPQPAATVADAVQGGSASPAALLALAAVNAFLHPLWRQQVVEDWRAGGCTGPLPRLLNCLMTRHTAAALDHTGHRQEAAAVKAAAKLCRKAAGVASSSGQSEGAVLAALASIARQRADFWRAARKPWKPPPGWHPIPQGSKHPELGHIAPLPPQWWTCFPQYRRQHRPAQQEQPGAHASSSAHAAAASPVRAGASPLPAGSPAALTPQSAAAAAGGSPLLEATPVSVPTAAAAAAEASGPLSLLQGAQRQFGSQPSALRVQQRSGVRSILKGSQQQLLWDSQEQELPGGLLDGDGSQQGHLPGMLLVGSDPTSFGRAGRRVQFQLPPSPTATGAGQQQEPQQQEPQQQEPQQQEPQQQRRHHRHRHHRHQHHRHQHSSGDGPEPMAVDGSSQEEQPTSSAAAAAAASEGPAAGEARHKRRRQLLPPLPQSLVADDDGVGLAAAATDTSLRARLQRRQQQWPGRK